MIMSFGINQKHVETHQLVLDCIPVELYRVYMVGKQPLPLIRYYLRGLR